MLKAFLIASIIVMLFSCNQERWIGITYPTGDLFNHQVIGEYSTLNSCLQAVRSRANKYECGLNCDTSRSPMVCDRTVGNEK